MSPQNAVGAGFKPALTRAILGVIRQRILELIQNKGVVSRDDAINISEVTCPSKREPSGSRVCPHGVELALTEANAAKVDPEKSEIGDGMRFRGRGFKQITGRANYADYWAHRGWLKPRIDYTESWWYHNNDKPAPITDPQRAANDPYNAIDIGGHFFIIHNMGKIADQGVTREISDKISNIINSRDTPKFPLRYDYVKKAYDALKDD